jgi:outer membrane protein assembly factor BamA
VQFDTRKARIDPDLDLTLPLHENPAAGYPTSGFLIDITSEVSPPVWDVDKTWGAIEGSVSAYISVGEQDRATLALRIGGRDTWGRTPFFKAAFIGGGEFFSGGSTVRGLRAERFAGDSSVFGNLDLRVFVARVKVVVPGDFGVLGFADVGRVFEDGESSKKWHPGVGGGVWFAPLARTNAISLSVAKSDEETLFYLRMGFAF